MRTHWIIPYSLLYIYLLVFLILDWVDESYPTDIILPPTLYDLTWAVGYWMVALFVAATMQLILYIGVLQAQLQGNRYNDIILYTYFGIMLVAAARARRRSLCGKSRTF